MEHFDSFFSDYDHTFFLDQIGFESGPSGNVKATENANFDQYDSLHGSLQQFNESAEGDQYMQAHDFIASDESLNAPETPSALAGDGQYSTTGICIEDQQWPPTNDLHVAQKNSEQYAWPSDAHGVYGTMGFPSWTMDSSMSDYVSPYSITATTNSHNHLSLEELRHDAPSDGRNILPTTLPSSDRSLPALEEQPGLQRAQEPQTVIDLTDAQDPPIRIGSVLENGNFMCDYDTCAGRTFARCPELRRHYTTIHAAQKLNFWCGVLTCRRSIGGGGEAFHRRDKLVSHVRNMHPEVVM